MWTVLLDPRAQKQLSKIPLADQRRIGKAIDQLRESPYIGDVKKIEGSDGTFRQRAGEYRIFFQRVKGQRLIRVHQILRCTSTTYR